MALSLAFAPPAALVLTGDLRAGDEIRPGPDYLLAHLGLLMEEDPSTWNSESPLTL